MVSSDQRTLYQDGMSAKRAGRLSIAFEYVLDGVLKTATKSAKEIAEHGEHITEKVRNKGGCPARLPDEADAVDEISSRQIIDSMPRLCEAVRTALIGVFPSGPDEQRKHAITVTITIIRRHFGSSPGPAGQGWAMAQPSPEDAGDQRREGGDPRSAEDGGQAPRVVVHCFRGWDAARGREERERREREERGERDERLFFHLS